MSLRPADRFQGEGRFADMAFTMMAGDGQAAESALRAAVIARTKSPFESHMALNQLRSRSPCGSASDGPDFGVPAALIVSGLFSPRWHQTIRSERTESDTRI